MAYFYRVCGVLAPINDPGAKVECATFGGVSEDISKRFENTPANGRIDLGLNDYMFILGEFRRLVDPTYSHLVVHGTHHVCRDQKPNRFLTFFKDMAEIHPYFGQAPICTKIRFI